jgi:DNA damage-binding protein 1
LGDHVNSIKNGSLVMQNVSLEFKNIKSLLYGTANGGIGVVGTLDKANFEFLLDVERAVNGVIKGIGGFSHDSYRSFQNEKIREGAVNFVDGDLIESLLELPKERVQEVVNKMRGKTTVEEVIKRIEEISLVLH